MGTLPHTKHCWLEPAAAAHLAPMTEARPWAFPLFTLITEALSSCTDRTHSGCCSRAQMLQDRYSAALQGANDGCRPLPLQHPKGDMQTLSPLGAHTDKLSTAGSNAVWNLNLTHLHGRGLGHGVAAERVGPGHRPSTHDVLILVRLTLGAGAGNAAAGWGGRRLALPGNAGPGAVRCQLVLHTSRHGQQAWQSQGGARFGSRYLEEVPDFTDELCTKAGALGVLTADECGRCTSSISLRVFTASSGPALYSELCTDHVAVYRG